MKNYKTHDSSQRNCCWCLSLKKWYFLISRPFSRVWSLVTACVGGGPGLRRGARPSDQWSDQAPRVINLRSSDSARALGGIMESLTNIWPRTKNLGRIFKLNPSLSSYIFLSNHFNLKMRNWWCQFVEVIRCWVAFCIKRRCLMPDVMVGMVWGIADLEWDDPSTPASSQIIIALNFKHKSCTKHNGGGFKQNYFYVSLLIFYPNISR